MNQPLLLPPGQAQQPKIELGLRMDENGVTVRIPIGPLTVIEQTIPHDMMDQLEAQRHQYKQEMKRMAQLTQDVMRSKR